MKIRQERFLDLLGMEGTRFVIPVFQRVYSWDARQCEELWEDVMAVGAQPEDAAEPHFMGMLLYATDTEAWNGMRQLDVIDGQQRMTTLSLLLCALARYLDETGEHVDGLSAADLFDRYLRTGSDAASTGKLVLSYMDRPTMFALMGLGDMPEAPAGRLIDNLELFFGKMQQPDFDAQRLWRGLERLEVAGVLLAHDDSPQLVFESLNSKGMALSTYDLIRNLLLIGIGLDEQERLYGQYWAPIEAIFADDLDSSQFTAALRGWLAIKAPELCKRNTDDIYATFKAYLESEHAGSLEELLFGLKGFCETFVTRSQSSGARMADAHNSYGVARVEGIISEKKLFGD